MLFDVIEELRADNSRLGKEKILQDNKNNLSFVETMKFVFNPFITTGLSAKKINKRVSIPCNLRFKHLKDVFEYLKANNTGTDQVIANIQQYLRDNAQYKDVLIEIFTKELTIGITATTINKVWGDVIPTFGVMLAERYDENKDMFGPGRTFIISQKLDGLRCEGICANQIEFFTRKGQPYEGFTEISKALSKFKKGYVYDGELLAKNPGKLATKDLFRLTGSIARRDGEKTGLVFNIFDMIPIEDFKKGYSPIPCIQRKEMLAAEFKRVKTDVLKLVENRYVGDDPSVIEEHLKSARLRDEEGIMINFADAGYECKRTKALLKYKKFNECDVRCIDVAEGQGRLKGTLGYITCEFMAPDNKTYIVECGSGFTDEQRKKYWKNPDLLIGKIVQLQYFDYSQNREGAYSLRFPVWLDIIRTDKDNLSRY